MAGAYALDGVVWQGSCRNAMVGGRIDFVILEVEVVVDEAVFAAVGREVKRVGGVDVQEESRVGVFGGAGLFGVG